MIIITVMMVMMMMMVVMMMVMTMVVRMMAMLIAMTAIMTMVKSAEHALIWHHFSGGPIQPTSPTDCWTEPESVASPRHNHSHSDSGISSMSGGCPGSYSEFKILFEMSQHFLSLRPFIVHLPDVRVEQL